MNRFFTNNENNDNSNNGGMDMRVIGQILTMDIFAESVRDAIASVLGEAYEVTVQEVTKVNVTKTGLIIRDKRCNMAPTIYLDGLYERFIDGENPVVICNEIINIYEQNKPSTDFDISAITDLNVAKDNIYCKVINAESNEEMLKNMPYKSVCEGLALVFYIDLSQMMNASATVTINNGHLESLGITKSHLYRIALENTKRKYKADIRSISSVMLEIMSDKLTEDNCLEVYDMACEMENLPVYVATNNRKEYGANILIYEDVLKDFADRIADDFYIIPSSLHELLFVPVSAGMNPRILGETVRVVNGEMSKEDILSNNIYRYYRNTDTIEIA